jgi:hypothetical protein
MTPRQTITMVICRVIPPAVIAAAIALPAGLTAQDHLITKLASSTGSAAVAPGGSLIMVLPGSFIHVLGGPDQDRRGPAHRIVAQPPPASATNLAQPTTLADR